MPDLTLDEVDCCRYCRAILRDPPNCCQAAVEDYEQETLRWLRAAAQMDRAFQAELAERDARER